MSIKIAIVDDKAQIRQSLADKLLQTGEVSVLFTAENGQDFLNKMAQLGQFTKPQVVLMDIEMPIKNGIESVREASALYPDTKYLMLTVFEDEDNIFESLKAGALGYMLKDEKISAIINAINEIHSLGGAPMSPRVARKTLQMLANPDKKREKSIPDNPETNLSEREIDILKLMVDGMDYREIAEVLLISPNTVRTHITNIYKKLHVSSRTQVVTLAIRKKWF